MASCDNLLTLSQILAYSMYKLSSNSIKIAVVGSLNKKISAKLTKVLQDIKVKAEVYLRSDKSNLKDIDIIYLDYLDADLLLKKLSNIVLEKSIVVLCNIFSKIYTDPTVLKNISDRGYAKAILPLDYGVALLSKKTYDKEFLNKTIEVYRESFIQGPNPVHYNTAYFLYILCRSIVGKAKQSYC